MRVVFMGTPEFACPSLAALLDAGYEVVGAFTQPDRPAGRGKKLAACPVKLLAESRGVPVYQFERVRRQEGLDAMRALQPDVVVTAAFGQILSQKLLDVPKHGTVNVHASLLPKHRGAAPINWAIVLGDQEAGVTTMFTDAGVDTGDMIMKRSTPIGENETAGELSERLATMGAELLIETLRAIEAGDCPREKQDPALMTHEPMLDKSMGLIDFNKTAIEIERQVRGLNPWPGAYAEMAGGTLKVWMVKAMPCDKPGLPGEIVVSSAKQGLIVKCGSGALEIIEMQAPDAKRMQAKAYLMGKPISVGTILNNSEGERG